MPLRAALALVLVPLLAAGCDCGGPSRMRDAGTAVVDAGRDVGDAPIVRVDIGDLASVDAYVPPNPDAYWFMDPPPSVCYPDGGMGPLPEPPGGTPECPADRNREGCRCDTPGETASCWPGPRRNRGRGICRDGTTTCNPYDEFSGTWGPCMGAVLPSPGATRGAAACECFSMGRWAIANLSPCFVDYGAAGVYAVSTFVNASGAAQCPTSLGSTPPPAPEPGTVWSTDTLTVDCAGQFRLCYTLRAGDADAPLDSDCMVAETCVETWYPEAGVTQTLPPLPSWTSSDSACARAFRDTGGYGEMSVTGFSVECDAIGEDDGSRYVFNRVNYCPLRCNTMPDLPECAGCMMGGSGSF
jgi:hypothetical protein